MPDMSYNGTQGPYYSWLWKGESKAREEEGDQKETGLLVGKNGKNKKELWKGQAKDRR